MMFIFKAFTMKDCFTMTTGIFSWAVLWIYEVLQIQKDILLFHFHKIQYILNCYTEKMLFKETLDLGENTSSRVLLAQFFSPIPCEVLFLILRGTPTPYFTLPNLK